MFLEFSKQDKFNEIIDNNTLVVFLFHKDNCARCITLEKQIKKHLENNELLVYSINANNFMNILRNNNIYAVPAILVYKNKELVYRNLGFIDFNEVLSKIN